MLFEDKHKKSLQYYIYSFVAAMVAVVLYGVYLDSRGEVDFEEWFFGEYFVYPFIIVIFLFVYHKLIGKARYKINEANNEERFLIRVSKVAVDKLELTPEEIDVFRSSPPFQRALYMAYEIAKYGEAEKHNYALLRNQFRPGTLEYRVLEVIADEVKLIREEREDYKKKRRKK